MALKHALVAVTVLAAAVAVETARAGDFVWPQGGRCTSSFYSSRPYGYHGAVDIAGPNGSAVIASRGGRVSFRGVSGGYGNLVIVSHAGGYQTYYAHLSRFGAGGNVDRGSVIGFEGSTGHSTGPHVHFEIRRYGAKKVAPASVGATIRKGALVPANFPGI